MSMMSDRWIRMMAVRVIGHRDRIVLLMPTVGAPSFCCHFSGAGDATKANS